MEDQGAELTDLGSNRFSGEEKGTVESLVSLASHLSMGVFLLDGLAHCHVQYASDQISDHVSSQPLSRSAAVNRRMTSGMGRLSSSESDGSHFALCKGHATSGANSSWQRGILYPCTP